jgi:hypothetical protein
MEKISFQNKGPIFSLEVISRPFFPSLKEMFASIRHQVLTTPTPCIKRMSLFVGKNISLSSHMYIQSIYTMEYLMNEQIHHDYCLIRDWSFSSSFIKWP